MKLETILDDYEKTILNMTHGDGEEWDKYASQANDHRAQILRMFAEKDGEIVILKEGAKYLKETRDKRDARIAELEDEVWHWEHGD